MAVYKQPSSNPPVDTLAAMVLSDPEPATITLLTHVNQIMHSLTTRWGYPPVIQQMQMLTGGSTRNVITQIPPSVTYAQIGVLVTGHGKVTLTDSGTSDTTTIEWHNPAKDEIGYAIWAWTSALPNDSTAAGEAPPLKLQASATWDCTPAHLISVNPATLGVGGQIHAVAVVPIWQPIAL